MITPELFDTYTFNTKGNINISITTGLLTGINTLADLIEEEPHLISTNEALYRYLKTVSEPLDTTPIYTFTQKGKKYIVPKSWIVPTSLVKSSVLPSVSYTLTEVTPEIERYIDNALASLGVSFTKTQT